MGTISTAFGSAFRDYNTDGNSGSGVKQVAKSDCRALGAIIEAYVTASFAAPLTISANTTAVTSPPAADAGYVFRLIGNGTSANQFLELDGFGGIPGVRLRRANITSAAASAVASGDVLGTFDVLGFGATTYSASARAQIRMVATQTWTATAHGSKIVFATTPNGSTTLTDAFTVDQDQSVSFAGAVSVTGAFTAGGAFTSAAQEIHTGIGYTAITATAQTVTLAATTPYHIVQQSAAYAAMTITFPSSPVNGQTQVVSINATGVTAGSSAVTTLTLSNGTFSHPHTTATAGQVLAYIYRAASTTWYRIN
ncbi:hypothetical protein [Caudoviricetes sp.]|nr:hypothetical protein [Caudoviricetes sp.]UOF81509.1 hypothetical protein [Caudoviricetes sp.]